MDYKEEFLQACSNIKREGFDGLMKWLEKSDFFVAPASSKYHGCHEGGLLEHSVNVYHQLDGLVQYAGLQDKYSAETIAIAALFHDLCKVNYYVKGKRNVKDENGKWIEKTVYEVDEKFPCGDHADKSIIIIQQYMKLQPEEILAIRAHMGGFDTSVKGGSFMVGKIMEKSNLALLLHLADMLATYLVENRES